MVRAPSSSTSQAVYRCSACHCARSRVARMLNRDTTLSEKWQDLPSEAKKEFYKKHHGKFGSELKAAIQESVVMKLKSAKMNSFDVKTTWHDEADLVKMFEGKEEQLKNVLTNASRFACPQRGVTLYGLANYESGSKEQESREVTEVYSLGVAKTQRATKAKALKDDDTTRTKRAKVEKGITKKGISQLEKQHSQMAKAIDTSEKVNNEIAPLADSIPQYAVEALLKGMTTAQEKQASLLQAIANNEGQVSELLKESRTAQKSLSECTRRASVLVVEAKKARNPEESTQAKPKRKGAKRVRST